MTGVDTDLKKIRAPRFIRSDKVIGIFSSMEANGNQMLQVSFEECNFSPYSTFKSLS